MGCHRELGSKLSVEVSGQAEKRVLERLLENMAAHNLCNERPYELLISFGLTRCNPLQHSSLGDLLSQADQQMYAQKQKRGRT